YNSVMIKRKEFEQKGGIPYDTHCCECNRPYPTRLLELWENKYICKPGCGGRSRMIQLNSNKRQITPPQSPILVKKAQQWEDDHSIRGHNKQQQITSPQSPILVKKAQQWEE